MIARRVSALLEWPLRRQIRVLGAMAVATVLVALALAVGLARQSESARVADAAGRLERAGSQIAARYAYLRQSFEDRRAAGPLDAGDDPLLQSLTAAVLAGIPGVEGGFFRAADGRLLGYAYPTYRGSGPKTDIPAAEAPTIERVARRAAEVRGPVEERVPAGADLILFRAQPVAADAAPVGAVWVMERLSGLRTPRGALYRAGLGALLVVAGGVAATAWWFTQRLDRGVTRIEAGLRAMEGRLETPVPRTGIPELDRVGSGINRLAAAVQAHQTERAALEGRLHRMDRLAALGRLVGGVAHEVRNPLASIKLKLHLARQSTDDRERLRGAFVVIEEELERLDRLVGRLLTLAKPAEPTRAPVDLARLVRTRLDLWQSRAAEQGVTLAVHEPTPGPDRVSLDGDRVAQILDNLITNAMDALIGRGGRITLSLTRPSASEVVLEVADTGPGVPRDLVERLFEPFFTTRAGGTGLGLFLSAELARGLGGEIRYRDRPGGGAGFEVRLPC